MKKSKRPKKIINNFHTYSTSPPRQVKVDTIVVLREYSDHPVSREAVRTCVIHYIIEQK